MAKPTDVALLVGEEFARLEQELAALQERVKQRAFEVSQREAGRRDHVRDWLDAECETCWRAPINVHETPDAIAIEIAVPGMAREHLTIGGRPGRLIVRGRKSSASNRESGDLRVREYNTQELYREIALPQDVDPARAKVDVEHGVATIKIARGAAKAPIANAPAASTPTTPKIEAKKPEPAKPAAAAAPIAPSKPLPSKAPIAPSKPTPAGKPAPVAAPTAPTAPTAKKPEAPAPKSNKSTSKPKPKSYGANG